MLIPLSSRPTSAAEQPAHGRARTPPQDRTTGESFLRALTSHVQENATNATTAKIHGNKPHVMSSRNVSVCVRDGLAPFFLFYFDCFFFVWSHRTHNAVSQAWEQVLLVLVLQCVTIERCAVAARFIDHRARCTARRATCAWRGWIITVPSWDSALAGEQQMCHGAYSSWVLYAM